MNDQGYVLVMGLLIASALLILLSTITGTIIIQRRLVDRSYHRERALALAESGIDIAIACLNEEDISEPYPEISEEIPEMGTFQVNFSDSTGSTITLTSTGYSKREEKEKAQRTVEVTANLTMKGTVFEYAVASGGDITIEDEGTTIEGDVAAVGSVNVDNPDNITGTITEGAELEFPEFDSDYYLANADTVIWGDWEIKEESDYPIDGIVYVKGDVKIEGSTLIGPGVIVAEGKIKIEDAILGTSSEGVGLISMSSEEEAIKIEGDDTEIYGMLWAPNGEVKIEDEVILYGSVVSGGDIKIEDGPRLIYYLGFGPEIYTYFKGNYLITIWSEIL